MVASTIPSAVVRRRISYSFYLFHGVVALVVYSYLPLTGHWSDLLTGLVSFALAILASHLVYRSIERSWIVQIPMELDDLRNPLRHFRQIPRTGDLRVWLAVMFESCFQVPIVVGRIDDRKVEADQQFVGSRSGNLLLANAPLVRQPWPSRSMFPPLRR